MTKSNKLTLAAILLAASSIAFVSCGNVGTNQHANETSETSSTGSHSSNAKPRPEDNLTRQQMDTVIDLNVQEAKRVVPLPLKQGVTWVDIDVSDDMLTYYNTVDETIPEYADLKAIEASTKDNLREKFAKHEMGEQFESFARVLINSGHSLRYQYKGNISGETISATFTPEELTELGY